MFKYIQFLLIRFRVFVNPFIPTGFELGIELTYPNEESTVAGLLFATSQIFCVIVAVMVAHIHAYWGTFWALVTLAVLLALGTLTEAFVPNKLLRQEAFKRERLEERARNEQLA